MILLLLFTIGLFAGLVISHILNRAILKNIERYDEELSEYFSEVVKALKRKYEPSVKDLQENTKTSKKNGNGDVKAALLALKYSAFEADNAIASLPEGIPTVEERIKVALRYFDKV